MRSMTNPTDGAREDVVDDSTVPLNGRHNGAPVPQPRGSASDRPRPDKRSPMPRTLLDRLGRAMRYVAGVDEQLMEKVRWERPQYASLGGVVLGTATIGAFSMWFAVGEATGVSSLVALLPAAIWFVFIVIVDRWIVTTRTADPWQKLIQLVTRGVIAILFGIVIAEPLVLRVFQTQIEHEVRTERADAIRQLQTHLQLCNPDPADRAAPPAPADCAVHNYVLSFSATPAAPLRQLTDLQSQARTLQQTITSDTNTLNSLNKKTTDECAGHSGQGLTGRYGDGINCEQDKANARQFANSHPIQVEQGRLADLQQQIATLQASTTDAQTTFVVQRQTAIEGQLAALPQVSDPIGLLERMAALAKLGAANATLEWGIILVRLLFITIDCAPVLLKIASGATFYDQLVLSSLDDGGKSFATKLEGNDSRREMDREEQEQQKREHAVHMQQRLADRVDERAAAYEQQARGPKG